MGRYKVSRKELLKEPDEITTMTGKAFEYILKNQTPVISAIVVLLLILAAATGIRYYLEKSEKTAFNLLQKATEKYEEVLAEKKPAEAYAAVKDDFEAILNDYSGKAGGKFARIKFADICYDANETDKAIELYQKALADFPNEPAMTNVIYSGLAYSYEMKKDLQNAIVYFEKIAFGNDAYLKEDALYHLGSLYAQTDRKDKSNEMFQKLIAEYPESVYIEMLKDKFKVSETNTAKS